MSLRRRVLVLASVCVAVPAFAQEGTPAPTPTPAPEKKICRSVVPTGSIMGKRICPTKPEWKRLDDTNAASAQTGLDARRMPSKKGDEL